MKTSMLAVALIFAQSVSVLAGTTAYTITEIPTLGGAAGEALGVNGAGHVVGWAELPGGNAHAFLWNGTSITDLGTLGGNVSYAYDINDAGRIVGQSEALAAPSVRFAFYIDPGDASQTALTNLPNTFNAVARTVNATGEIAGASLTIDELDAVIWGESGEVLILPAFLDEPAAQGDVWDSNDANDLVGGSKIVDLDTGYVGMRAAMWPGGQFGGDLVEVGTLGGNFSQARGINNGKEVVGTAGLPVAQSHAFLWKGGTMQDLGDLGDGSIAVFSVAQDINDARQVVGYSQFEEFSTFRAFVWEDGVMADLNALIPAGSGWELTHANAVNEVGQIVGRGIAPGGEQRAFLLTPSGSFGPPGIAPGMTVARNDTAGSSLRIDWDTDTCSGAVDHHLLYGDASDLPSSPGDPVAPVAGVCSIGSNAPFVWADVPDAAEGLLWWLVVATDGDATEGSWGIDGDGLERQAPGGGGSMLCGATFKDVSNACP